MRTTLRSSITALLAAASLFALTATARASFDWENLEGDIPGVAEIKDPNVINPWGLALSPSGTIFVADNGAGVATVYFQDGTPAPSFNNRLVITIPTSSTNTGDANPTGVAANNTPFFKVTNGSNTLPAKMIFVSEDGTISGWNSNLSNTQAFKAVDNGPSGAVYKGATLGANNGQNFLFVTNFSSGRVETYNQNFQAVNPSGFTDPNLPADYAPFGIRNLNGRIFVTYAKRNPSNPDDDLAGAGFGYVDVFNTNGQLLRRLISNGRLNAPWGLEIVNGQLWVGNFGDGKINVYDPSNGNFLGTPRDTFGIPLAFDGLWGLFLSNGYVFFTAGIADEDHGIFGAIF
ncbi:MAG: hypothetical protein QOE81_265 [Verrucomicrobiota bacterium]|jgi:uncharacterized protein (TIGR03118 family)